MDADLDRRAMDGFEEALGVPSDGRGAWIDRRFRDDPPLRDAVRRLIAAGTRSGLLPTEPPRPSDRIDAVAMPERIGPYRPVELIGEGGMGRVYRAERSDGHFQQTVAIKIISARLFAGTSAEQFRVERQILARLVHPNIARLLDGGVTADGLSYIVMELIGGDPITLHADAAGLHVKARLTLFRDVCAAVQYAHQQLVVHADIKPGNILVDPVRDEVKLLDFGIGALLGDGDRQEEGGRASTPEWASPQLVAGHAPTPADDIYALGLLLRALTPAEIAADPDLAAIAARAAAEQAADRYVSADALSADVQRWLDRLPVLARPSGTLHRANLFWRRNRLAVVLAAIVALALLAALATTTALYLRAETARRQAQQRFEEVRALSRFMLTDVTDALVRSPGTSKLRQALAVRGRDYLERLSRVPGASPDLRLETAKGYAKVGAILARNSDQNAGDPVGGRAALVRAERQLRPLVQDFPGRDDIKRELAQTLIVEASVAAASFNDFDAALHRLDEADRLLDAIAARDPRCAECGWVRWDGLNTRAYVYDQQSRFEAMKPVLAAALRDGRALPISPRHAADRVLRESASLHLLADAEYYSGHVPESLRAVQGSVAVVDRARAHSNDARLFDRAAFYRSELASTLSVENRSPEALRLLDEAVAITAQLRTFDTSPRTLHIENTVTLQRAVTLGELHRYPEAIAATLANIASRRALAAAQPDNYEVQRAVPVAMRPLVEIYFDAGRPADACRLLADTRLSWTRTAAIHPLGVFDRTSEMAVLDKLGRRCRGS